MSGAHVVVEGLDGYVITASEECNAVPRIGESVNVSTVGGWDVRPVLSVIHDLPSGDVHVVVGDAAVRPCG